MASLMSRIQKFAQSKQGKELTHKAMDVAKDPKTRRQIDGLRKRFMGGGKTPPRQG